MADEQSKLKLHIPEMIDGSTLVCGENGNVVADITKYGVQYQQLIVTAVNNHTRMKEALEDNKEILYALVKWVELHGANTPKTTQVIVTDIEDRIRETEQALKQDK